VDHEGIGGAALIVTLADVRVGCRGAGAVAVGVHIEPEPAAARGAAAAQLVVDRLFAFGGDFEEERVGEFLLQDEGVSGYVFFLCGVSHPGSLGPGGYVQGGEDRAAGGFQLAAAGVSAVVAVADVAARARAAQGICPHRGAAQVAASGVGSCSPGVAVGRGGLVGCAATGRGIERAVQAGRMPCAGGSARALAPQTHPPAGGRRSRPLVLECARTRALG
jgi:hypothetical protein